LPWWFRSTW